MTEYIKNSLSGKLRGVTYEDGKIIDVRIRDTDDVVKVFVPVRHGRREAGRCSNCKKEAVYISWDEPIYDYDWEENLRFSYTETHTEYHLTNYCPNCGAVMENANA